jgi:hypothetical protein
MRFSYTTVREPAINAGAKSVRIDGCLFGKPSPKDFRAVPQLTSPPRKVDLRPSCSPIEDQGQLGSCTANAAIGALEYYQRKRGEPQIDLSRLFVYFNARRMRGQVRDDSGAEIAEAMAALLAYGAPAEQHWPYDIAKFTEEPGQAVYGEALKNQPAEYARVERGDGVIGALARGYPVVFGIQLPRRCFEEAATSGVIPEPTQAELADVGMSGGHAMLIVGYDLDRKTYLVRNSWGANWGDRGYCTMPIAATEQTTRSDEFWIIGRLESGGDFKLIKPQREPVVGTVTGMAAKMREDIRGGLEKSMTEAGKSIRDRFRQKPPGER